MCKAHSETWWWISNGLEVFQFNGVGKLIFIDGIMRNEEYLKILEDNLHNWRGMVMNSEHEFIFQQDNDPKHTAKIVSTWFAENNVNVLDLVAQSPDMNPIGHLWEYLDRKVRKKKLPNIPDLKAPYNRN